MHLQMLFNSDNERWLILKKHLGQHTHTDKPYKEP